MKKSILTISTILLLTLAACKDGGNNSNTQSTDSKNDSSAKASVNDTAYMKRADVEKMIKAINDTVAKLAEENRKLKTNPPKHPPVTFPERTPYMAAIDWEWNNPNPPAQMKCLGYIVTGDGPVKIRGNATAHDCVVNAIQAYRQDRLEGAINWLCAAQCHNDAAQQDLRNGGQMAAQYALQTYGMNVPE